MTEAEWLASPESIPMLESHPAVPNERKLTLFSCACCRRIWPLLVGAESRDAVEMMELYADNPSADELRRAGDLAEMAFRWFPWEPNGMPSSEKLAASAVWGLTDRTETDLFGGHSRTGFAINTALQSADATSDQAAERREQAAFLRDIFGNPFRPVALEPAWQTEAVVGIARGIYEDRAFERMPILADALQDAGCENADILSHCREPGVHVRGCWVVDLILGKE